VDPPVIQPLRLMLDLAGEAMRARLFIVQDEGGREACLRPDFTVAAARAHLESGRGAGRYRYEGRAFRVAPPGAGEVHPEEFLQMGAEAFGELATPAADGEILGAAWQAANAGGRGDLTVRLGDVALFGQVLAALEVAEPVRGRLTRALGRPRQLAALLQRAGGTEPLEGRAAEIARMPAGKAIAAIEADWTAAGLEPVGGRSAAEIAERLAARAEAGRAPRLSPRQLEIIQHYLGLTGSPRQVIAAVAEVAGRAVADVAAADWRARLEAADLDPERVVLATRFARAFGYYDGFLFEIVSAALPADAAVAAGGRYDGLFAQLGGAAQAAVGCMVRPARAWRGAA
jgi:ATP phosphoribosyltransferase regulatory subunit